MSLFKHGCEVALTHLYAQVAPDIDTDPSTGPMHTTECSCMTQLFLEHFDFESNECTHLVDGLALQVTAHLLWEQFTVARLGAWQTWPQPPQLLTLLVASTHRAPDEIRLAHKMRPLSQKLFRQWTAAKFKAKI